MAPGTMGVRHPMGVGMSGPLRQAQPGGWSNAPPGTQTLNSGQPQNMNSNLLQGLGSSQGSISNLNSPFPSNSQAVGSSQQQQLMIPPPSQQQQQTMPGADLPLSEGKETSQKADEPQRLISTASPPTPPPALTSSGKERQFLINPLTGMLEPMPSESSSDSEVEATDKSVDTLKEDSFFNFPSPLNDRSNSVYSDDDDDVSSTLSRRADTTTTTTDQSDSEATVRSTASETSSSRRARIKTSREANSSPAPEKIKLRLKLEKSEPAYKVVGGSGGTAAIQYTGQAGGSQPSAAGSGTSGEEPRVPPLHISLRGRGPMVVSSRKESKKWIKEVAHNSGTSPVNVDSNKKFKSAKVLTSGNSQSADSVLRVKKPHLVPGSGQGPVSGPGSPSSEASNLLRTSTSGEKVRTKVKVARHRSDEDMPVRPVGLEPGEIVLPNPNFGKLKTGSVVGGSSTIPVSLSASSSSNNPVKSFPEKDVTVRVASRGNSGQVLPNARTLAKNRKRESKKKVLPNSGSVQDTLSTSAEDSVGAVEESGGSGGGGGASPAASPNVRWTVEDDAVCELGQNGVGNGDEEKRKRLTVSGPDKDTSFSDPPAAAKVKPRSPAAPSESSCNPDSSDLTVTAKPTEQDSKPVINTVRTVNALKVKKVDHLRHGRKLSNSLNKSVMKTAVINEAVLNHRKTLQKRLPDLHESPDSFSQHQKAIIEGCLQIQKISNHDGKLLLKKLAEKGERIAERVPSKTPSSLPVGDLVISEAKIKQRLLEDDPRKSSVVLEKIDGVPAPEAEAAPNAGGEQGNTQGEDSGIESMDALSEKSPNQGESPCRKEEKDIDSSCLSQDKKACVSSTTSSEPKSQCNEVKREAVRTNSLISKGGDEVTNIASVLSSKSVIPTPTKHSSPISSAKVSPLKDAGLVSALAAKVKSAMESSPTKGGDQKPKVEAKSEPSSSSPDQTPAPVSSPTLEDPQPIRTTPPLYTYSNPEKHRDETPSPTNIEEDDGDPSTEEGLLDCPSPGGAGNAIQRRRERKRRLLMRNIEKVRTSTGDEQEDGGLAVGSSASTVNELGGKAANVPKTMLQQLLIEIPPDGLERRGSGRSTRSQNRMGHPSPDVSLNLKTPKSSPGGGPVLRGSDDRSSSPVVSGRNNSNKPSPNPVPRMKRKRQNSDSSAASSVTDDLNLTSSSSTPRPGKRKCSENAAELIKACMGVDGQKAGDAAVDVAPQTMRKSRRGGSSASVEVESSDDEPLIEIAVKGRRDDGAVSPGAQSVSSTSSRTAKDEETKSNNSASKSSRSSANMSQKSQASPLGSNSSTASTGSNSSSASNSNSNGTNSSNAPATATVTRRSGRQTSVSGPTPAANSIGFNPVNKSNTSSNSSLASGTRGAATVKASPSTPNSTGTSVTVAASVTTLSQEEVKTRRKTRSVANASEADTAGSKRRRTSKDGK